MTRDLKPFWCSLAIVGIAGAAAWLANFILGA